MKRVRVVDTKDEARRIRETFVDRAARREQKLPFDWPTELVEPGRCLSVMYSSDKWHEVGDFEDYKHLAEAPQWIAVRPGFLRWWEGGRAGAAVDVVGPAVELVEPLPRHFAFLAPFLGVQIQLYEGMSRNGSPRLGRGAGSFVEVKVPRAKLGGARHPETGAAFLLVYTEERGGLHAIVSGDALDIEKDGIVG